MKLRKHVKIDKFKKWWMIFLGLFVALKVKDFWLISNIFFCWGNNYLEKVIGRTTEFLSRFSVFFSLDLFRKNRILNRWLAERAISLIPKKMSLRRPGSHTVDYNRQRELRMLFTAAVKYSLQCFWHIEQLAACHGDSLQVGSH